MKKYLWSVHIILGVIGLFLSVLRGEDFTELSLYSVIFSIAALSSLVYIHVSETKNT
jgi:hypothetical protein